MLRVASTRRYALPYATPPEQEVFPSEQRLDETYRPRRPSPGPPRGRPERSPHLAPDPRRRLLRKPDRHPRARSPERHHHLRKVRPRRLERTVPGEALPTPPGVESGLIPPGRHAGLRVRGPLYLACRFDDEV